jgi:hypothetical protein
MTTEEQIKILEEKIDIVLSLLGHGREKSHAQICREAEATVDRLRRAASDRARKKEKSIPGHSPGQKKRSGKW